MSEKSSKFLGKISPLIEGQLPDFIRDENPLFVKFVKDYYKFLEAGKMELTATNDYIKYETETVNGPTPTPTPTHSHIHVLHFEIEHRAPPHKPEPIRSVAVHLLSARELQRETEASPGRSRGG